MINQLKLDLAVAPLKDGPLTKNMTNVFHSTMVDAKETRTIIKQKVLVIITAKSPALVNVSTNYCYDITTYFMFYGIIFMWSKILNVIIISAAEQEAQFRIQNLLYLTLVLA